MAVRIQGKREPGFDVYLDRDGDTVDVHVVDQAGDDWLVFQLRQVNDKLESVAYSGLPEDQFTLESATKSSIAVYEEN